MNCDSLIFALDGTLWDASEAVSQSWAHTLRNTYQVKNPPSIAEIQSIMGLSAREIADRLFSRYGEDPDEIAQYCMRQECDYLAVHGGRLYAGVEPTLRDLAQHYHLSIVSNCQQGYIESFLHFYHLEPLFTDFDCEGNTGLSKSENIRRLIRRNALTHPVYIGDTQMDFQAATQAGAAFIWASYGFGHVPEAALRINRFPDLLTLLPSLE